jgi:hypothetical protein
MASAAIPCRFSDRGFPGSQLAVHSGFNSDLFGKLTVSAPLLFRIRLIAASFDFS